MQQKLQQKRIEAKTLKPKLVLKQKPFKALASKRFCCNFCCIISQSFKAKALKPKLVFKQKLFKTLALRLKMQHKLQQKHIEAKVYAFDSNLKWTLKRH